jgi:uncharacterized membrane protein YedE/YeeE
MLAAAVSGIVFGAGLALGGMTQPEKVLGFLDVFGNWDPSLLFVMGGAVAVHTVGYRLVRRRERPLADDRFLVPGGGAVDSRLVIGSLMFGAGWGLSGYCPGPLVASLPAGTLDAFVFASFLLLGIALANALDARWRRSSPELKAG